MRITLLIALFFVLLPGEISFQHRPTEGQVGYAHARAGSKAAQKDAFESSKELGTIEAWEAFLKAYPKGFYADLARAYVRKLAGTPAKKKRSKKQKAKSSGKLEPVAAEPGRTPWRVRRYEMDEGNASEMAASVSASGIELLFHCDGKKRLTGVMRETKRRKYPDFDARIRQGLQAKGANPDRGTPAFIPMIFSDGTAYSVSASVQGLTGEVSLAQDVDGSGFQAGGNLVSDLMTKKTVRIDAPPFGATLQLKKSRKALCSVIKRCGARVARCGNAKRTVSRKKKTRKRKKRTPSKANSPYYDSQGKLLEGYIIDKDGNINQDNGGGE